MAISGTLAAPLSDHDHQVQLRRAVVASTVGTAIEWYDFSAQAAPAGRAFAGSDRKMSTKMRASARIKTPVVSTAP
jgi:hypothetical protein